MSARKYLNETGLASLWTKIVNKINALGDLCVKKAGDTMTGALTTPRVLIPKGDTNGIWIRTKVDPAGTTYDTAGPINIIDNNGNTMFQIHPYHDGNGNGDMLTEFYFYCKKPNNSYVNSFSVGFDAWGNPKVEFWSPSAWKTGLGLATVASSGNYNDLTNKPTIPDISTKVSKSGDTMTGTLTVANSSSPTFLVKATNVDASKANNNVSSTQYPCFYMGDNSGRILTRFESVIESSGNIGSFWYCRNYNTSGGQVAQKGIRMTLNKSGTLTWAVDNSYNFNSALGLNQRTVTTGTFRGASYRIVEYYNFYFFAFGGDASSTTSGYESVVTLSKGDTGINIGAPLGGWSNPAQNGQIQWNSGYVKALFQTTGYKGGYIIVPKSTLG